MTMKNILFLLLSLLYYQNINACCAGERYSLTELLLSQSDPRSILLVTIDSSWMDASSNFYSYATVDQVFKNAPKTNKIKIRSGANNSSAGGQLLMKGGQYLLVNGTRDGYLYSGFVCDVFSKSIWERSYSSDLKRQLVSTKGNDYLDLIQEHFEKVNTNYTGSIVYKLNNHIVATGNMKKGKPVGEWQHFDYYQRQKKTFLRSSATYKKGLLHGIVTKYHRGYGDAVNTIMNYEEMKYSNGNLLSHYHFNKDLDGSFYETYKKMVIYTPEYTSYSTTTYYGKDTLRQVENRIKIPFPKGIFAEFPMREINHGVYRKYNRNGDILESGQYWWGAKVGEWQYYNEDGTFKELETYEQPNRLTDRFTTLQPNGMVAIEGSLKNGQPDGEWKSYQGKTIRKTAEFKDGKLDGWVRSYRSDGYVYQRYTYKNGVKDGEAVSFAGKGNIRTQIGHYKNDHKIDEWKEYFSNDNRSMKAKMFFNEDGHLTDAYQSFYENGMPNLKCNYINGMYDGLYQKYNKDGLLIEQGHYRKGQKIGVWKRYLKRKKWYSICDFGTYIPKAIFGHKVVEEGCLYKDLDGNVVTF